MVSLFLFLLSAATVFVDGQLEFTASQRGRDINLNCTLPGIRDTEMQLLISMSVSRLTDSKEEILASVSSIGSRPVAHGGIVTSHISMDGSAESYVNIEWVAANSSLEGEYVCKFNGLDLNNSPVLLTQTLTLTLQDTGPGIIATPDVLEIGITESLSIKCFVSELATLNVSQISSIDLTHEHGGIDQLLASISIFDGTQVKNGSGIDSLAGQLGNNANEEYFLEAVWQNPNLTRSGVYECTFNGIDTTGSPVHFKFSFDLEPIDPSKEDLIKQLQDLQENFDLISQENKELTEERDLIASRVRILEESLKGHKSCDTVDLPVGQYPITLYPDDGDGLINVLCHVVEAGDIWTVFQKRFNGSIDFARGFVAYNDGFGSVNAEHWLGLKTMKRIMKSGNFSLRVDVIDYNGGNHTSVYPTFELGPFDGYALTVGGYNDGGHGLSFSSGADFSTFDHGPQPHCATQDNSGWWFDNCAFSNLNGKWGEAGESGVAWFEIPEGRTHPLKSTEMKFKRSDIQ